MGANRTKGSVWRTTSSVTAWGGLSGATHRHSTAGAAEQRRRSDITPGERTQLDAAVSAVASLRRAVTSARACWVQRALSPGPTPLGQQGNAADHIVRNRLQRNANHNLGSWLPVGQRGRRSASCLRLPVSGQAEVISGHVILQFRGSSTSVAVRVVIARILLTNPVPDCRRRPSSPQPSYWAGREVVRRAFSDSPAENSAQRGMSPTVRAMA